VSVTIDFEGITHRILALHQKPAITEILIPVEGGLLYLNGGKLEKYDIAEEKSKEIMDKTSQVLVSADKKMMLYRSKNEYRYCGDKTRSKT
jgi:tricorn protease